MSKYFLVHLLILLNISFLNEAEEYSYLYNNIEDDLSLSEDSEYGKLTGDVQNWAAILQNYIIQLASDHINRDLTQQYFDLANYTVEAKDGEEVVKEVKDTLSNYFTQKQAAAIVRIIKFFLIRKKTYSFV
jgi:hypothetical protein